VQTITLSEAALALLRRCLETGRSRVTPENLESYRELARADVMYPVSGFASGEEASFRFMDAGWAMRFEFGLINRAVHRLRLTITRTFGLDHSLFADCCRGPTDGGGMNESLRLNLKRDSRAINANAALHYQIPVHSQPP
jgi:hypothetical protein